jgi:hypothetical protein
MSSPKEQAERSVQQGKMFIAQTRNKMKQLVDDFADGKLNKEQFHVLYERYQSQINGVKLILAENDPTTWTEALAGDETITLRKRLLAKATGMAIYINKGGTLLDTLGKFNIVGHDVTKIMEKFNNQLAKERATPDDEVDNLPTIQRYSQLVIEMPPYGWVFVAKGRLVMIINTFTREPTQDQRDTMIRLLRDFETANASHLMKENVTSYDLVMPFRVFVQREAK